MASVFVTPCSVVKTAVEAGVVPGMWGNIAFLPLLAASGFKFMVIGADVHMLINAMQEQIKAATAEMKKHEGQKWVPRETLHTKALIEAESKADA